MNLIVTQSYKIVLKHVALYIVIIMLSQCTLPEKQTKEHLEYKQELSSKLYNIKTEDSLLTILNLFTEEKDDIGKMICYKHLGAVQRANAHYSKAMNSHKQGLEIALRLSDTIEIVQAMNNLGTNFRRIGAYSESSQYHQQALYYAEAWSGKNTPIGIENCVTSLNGIGNISRMIGYYKDAETHFRKALKYQDKHDNPKDQAKNYANLGTIFEIHGQHDSAFVYYQKSMEQNIIAKSNIGIGVNRMHFGDLYEYEKKYDLAKVEYQNAYDLLNQTSNKWHWLYACIGIARVDLATNNITEYKNYIELAKSGANEIKSSEHLAAIYLLEHDYYLNQGNHQLALEQYKQHKAMQDSVQGMQKANRYMDIRLGHEQNKSALRFQQIEDLIKIELEKKEFVVLLAKIIFFVALIIILLLYYSYYLRTRSNKILKKLERTRTDFYTNITHEFRTPLTVIQGLNRQMQQKKDLTDKEKTAYRAAIDRQSNNVLTLVNQLLDVAKLRQGSEEPKWKRGNIVGYLQMTAETFRIYAGEKDVTLMFYSEKDVIEMDFVPSYIDKIISNLLSNAIKHTEAGDKIDFAISSGKSPDTIIMHISDTGEGIPEKDLERIFDFFYQCQETRNNSGSGIGLAYTRMLTRKMKGKIEVESQLGEGTVFTVTLPLKNKKAPRILPLKTEEKPISSLPEKKNVFIEEKEELEKIKNENRAVQPLILIVEDNRDIALYLKSLLIEHYNVITARNGSEGLEAAEKNVPDMVITDLMMPVKDGYELVCEMKQSRLLNHIPIIMVTAKTTDEDHMKSLRCGVNAYIRKPFNEEELLIRIENIFENTRILKEKYMSVITRNSPTTKLDNDDNLKFLQTITTIIHSEINNPNLNSSFLASKMAMSISQLSRKINGITGYSTISYVLQLKLNKAKKMLADDTILISEVSDACGFYDASYFSRVFKKEFGKSPSHYQKKLCTFIK